MTISTYSDLKTQIAAFLNRSDLTTQIPVFVQLAESRIFYGSDPLRVQDMETSTNLTFNTQRVSLPSDFLERRRVYIANGTSKIELEYKAPAQFWSLSEASQSGTPKYFTIEKSEIVLAPSPDSSYTGYLLYYAKYDDLSSDSDTNWLLTNAPGVYLDGALMEAFSYLFDGEKMSFSAASFANRIASLNNADKAARHSGTPWVGRSDTGNP